MKAEVNWKAGWPVTVVIVGNMDVHEFFACDFPWDQYEEAKSIKRCYVILGATHPDVVVNLGNVRLEYTFEEFERAYR